MTRHSVEAYDIHDKEGRVLYNGDYVERCWGGRNGKLIYRTHRLTITKSGRLRISGCENITYGYDLIKLDTPTHPLDEVYSK